MTERHEAAEIGAHALVAGAGTAALLDPAGDVAWLPWPRIDSEPCFLSILDPERGGVFETRVPGGGAGPARRSYRPGTLVLDSDVTVGGGAVRITDAMTPAGAPRLVRVVRAIGGAAVVSVAVRAVRDWGRAPAPVAVEGRVVRVRLDGANLAVTGPSSWTVEDGGLSVLCTLRLAAGEGAGLVVAEEPVGDAPRALLDGIEARWAERTGALRWRRSPLAERCLGAEMTDRLLGVAAAVLLGLRREGGGIVAAPTTSLPQWPGTGRTWDYRYAWLRDTALAGMAMLRLRLDDEAEALGRFCGVACAGGDVPPMLRVDGTPPPREMLLHHLSGHGGARPVRVGNAAAQQAQVDVIGEVVDFAHALERAGRLPRELADAVPLLAGLAARRWAEPDHGIWEVRGATRPYTHSRLMAWTALRRAAALARRGAVRGDSGRWLREAEAVAAGVLEGAATGPLELVAGGGGGPDAALALAPLVGLPAPSDPRARATLDLIAAELARGGLLDRYRGQLDGISAPCAPFLFPTFWMASAMERCGADGGRWLAAATAARGELDLFGEVADPATGAPLGNFPQVQSHASFVLAATVPHERRVR